MILLRSLDYCPTFIVFETISRTILWTVLMDKFLGQSVVLLLKSLDFAYLLDINASLDDAFEIFGLLSNICCLEIAVFGLSGKKL